MVEVLLSRDDLALVDVGIQCLQAVRGVDNTAVRRVSGRVEPEGIASGLWGPDAILIDFDPVMSVWAQVKGMLREAFRRVFGGGGSKSIAFKDRALAENLNLEPRASLEELIEARRQWEWLCSTPPGS